MKIKAIPKMETNAEKIGQKNWKKTLAFPFSLLKFWPFDWEKHQY